MSSIPQRKMSGLRKERKSILVQDTVMLRRKENPLMRGLQRIQKPKRLQKIQQHSLKDVRPDIPLGPRRMPEADKGKRIRRTRKTDGGRQSPHDQEMTRT
jgi:hypothetical protein